ncbi:Xaa-Pro dipeptidase [Erwinia sp. OLTSP20]|uniref:Xaa-Pro dipeptidase n=1 Tax=unclassified Erwinia TaxID=2622719 RepID=UPI000C178602|nr:MULTISPECIES: Xaa-Pro dipeptidase [unclassified Erwinia]PIJ50814.1 Xaa-Pro dipeptidase [Erwinia sp. OAMSP11]PIJ72966.1 Xaa-Pro dipeptidase [Erwinia sp. OLSSP12]PIJ81981.1 Xaa-Pro dipeptidase [Erwinia sp. OLCASP19]PIJ84636.1 Xaa-Pro dipeptidase [Erwinia sp. OLMTSP26]PIJ86985.1 Xaa-Pro dipeptidase [Erwinia sp. OLMDSP33]
MDSLVALYQEHLQVLQRRAQQALARASLDAMLIHSGELLTVFLDDHDYPFKVNPQFKHWIPVTDLANCWLWVDGVNKPKLWFYSPIDYWHKVQPVPQDFWTAEIDIMVLRDASEIGRLLPAQRENIAYIGPAVSRASQLGLPAEHINPQGLIDYLHFYRGYKTPYELTCMRQAQKIAVLGHQAAKEAFLSEMSEFDINMAYLSATGHRDTDVPYGNIVALNEHAAILHYTQPEQQVPRQLRSFLLDAGAEYNGYAADITRSYAAQPDSEFAALVADMDGEQQALIADLKTGVRYSDYHQQMNQRIARLLIRHDLVKGLSEEALVAENITAAFMPHGLGHPLGLQVHDVGGFMQDDYGTQLAAPRQYPYLRCTRILEPGMVLTIEPGIYFIGSLLAPWRESRFSSLFNWGRIDTFKAYGGIRIEDNVVFHDNRIENMTRALNLH